MEPFAKDIKQGPGLKLEAKDHINILEPKTAKFSIMMLTKVFFVILSLLQNFFFSQENFL